MIERDREAADDWIRYHLPDLHGYSLEDSEEEGDTQKHFFLRFRDSATVVYRVAAKSDKVTSVLQEVYHGEGQPGEQRRLLEPKGGKGGFETAP